VEVIHELDAVAPESAAPGSAGGGGAGTGAGIGAGIGAGGGGGRVSSVYTFEGGVGVGGTVGRSSPGSSPGRTIILGSSVRARASNFSTQLPASLPVNPCFSPLCTAALLMDGMCVCLGNGSTPCPAWLYARVRAWQMAASGQYQGQGQGSGHHHSPKSLTLPQYLQRTLTAGSLNVTGMHSLDDSGHSALPTSGPGPMPTLTPGSMRPPDRDRW
jgi:hypothetical protein